MNGTVLPAGTVVSLVFQATGSWYGVETVFIAGDPASPVIYEKLAGRKLRVTAAVGNPVPAAAGSDLTAAFKIRFKLSELMAPPDEGSRYALSLTPLVLVTDADGTALTTDYYGSPKDGTDGTAFSPGATAAKVVAFLPDSLVRALDADPAAHPAKLRGYINDVDAGPVTVLAQGTDLGFVYLDARNRTNRVVKVALELPDWSGTQTVSFGQIDEDPPVYSGVKGTYRVSKPVFSLSTKLSDASRVAGVYAYLNRYSGKNGEISNGMRITVRNSGVLSGSVRLFRGVNWVKLTVYDALGNGVQKWIKVIY